MVDFHYANSYKMEDLLRIMELLRAPGGCPWDREQTHQSIRRNMLEEAYEVAEAIDQQDPAHLKEELGDVLLQVVFHARMAEEDGQFTFDDVVDGICKKLVFRHPHVFGRVDAQDSDKALSTWEEQKKAEKGQKTAGDTLDAVARSLPALMRAEKLQDKARKAGFDWNEVGPALDKLSEEVSELRQAVEANTNPQEELGDVLFAAVKVGRFLGVDSELTLHAACEKFIGRFRNMEALAGGSLEGLDLPRLEELWCRAKEQEHTQTTT